MTTAVTAADSKWPSSAFRPPLGWRGERPVKFYCKKAADTERVLGLPGAEIKGRTVACAWELAEVCADILGAPVPKRPDVLPAENCLGMPDYVRLFKPKLRDYQKLLVKYLGMSGWGGGRLGCRLGKSMAALAAREVLGLERCLVVTVDSGLWGWVNEFLTWTERDVVVPSGRSGLEAVVPCRVCMARGQINGSKCEACVALNGQSRGYTIITPRTLPCRVHPACTESLGEHCAACVQHFEHVFATHDVLTTYDVLTAHKSRTLQGVEVTRLDLPGWADRFAAIDWPVAILDEAQTVRSRTKAEKNWTARVGRVKWAVWNAWRVWELSATFLYTYVRDYHSEFQIASKGLMGSKEQFDVRYCDRKVDEEFGGVDNTGESELASTELPRRVKHFIFSLTREECVGPETEPQVTTIWYDAPEADGVSEADVLAALSFVNGTDLEDATAAAQAAEEHLSHQLRRAFEAKFEGILEQLRMELAAGNKLVCYGHHVDDVRRLFDDLVKGRRGDNKAIKEAPFWFVSSRGLADRTGPRSGDKARLKWEFSQEYGATAGACCLFATTTSMETGLSLPGAHTYHYVQLEWSQSAITQSRQRSDLPGFKRPDIVIHSVRDSVDERIQSKLDHRFWLSGQVGSDDAAGELHGKFREPVTAKSIWDAHCASVLEAARARKARGY